jgi:2-methylisocitrate lyase-like PEP mutase family enzyme
MNSRQQLVNRLRDNRILMAPGVFDALSTLLVEQAGFDAAYLSGASIAYTRFGRPDLGLVDMSEVAETLSAITERTELPLLVDADTGFGNALNVARTVRLFERVDAAAIQLEDQTLPKRCGHLTGKSLVSRSEMVGKIHAALDARHQVETLIVARTDAIAVEGLEAALERADAYLEAGADILFVEAPQSEAQIRALTQRFAGRIPLLANMVEGGQTPRLSAQQLENYGYALVIFPGSLVRAFAHLAQTHLASLRDHGTTEPLANAMLDFPQLNALLGTSRMLDQGRRYSGDDSK